MGGISGIIRKDGISSQDIERATNAIKRLDKRGPDYHVVEKFDKAVIAYNQLGNNGGVAPQNVFKDRYFIAFDGAIYNTTELREDLLALTYQFESQETTEVLLQAYLHYGPGFLNQLNGAFAIVIYDIRENNLLLARDRYGIKPLLIFENQDSLVFASEMKAMMEYDIPREIDQVSLYTYFQLNYIPEPHSIFQRIKKLEPGCYIQLNAKLEINRKAYYSVKYLGHNSDDRNYTYKEAQEKFIKLLDQSVEERLSANTSVGAFLSGGIDSSLITALAAQKVDKLDTFSIGFKDEPNFDESYYAKLLADKYNTNHHAFLLSKEDLLESFNQSLSYIDEPFADSSALLVNVLSRETVKHVGIALSGDGADELFGGYHKHRGEFLMREKGMKQTIVKGLSPLWKALPKSRNNQLGNLIRKLDKFAEGSKMELSERYWLWASLMTEFEAAKMLLNKADFNEYLNRKEELIKLVRKGDDINYVLISDVKMVLNGDMLRKVDAMSMNNSLEVRTPFLSHHIVDFAFSIHADYKVNSQMGKRLVQDAARDLFPTELYNRRKQGFEVPLLPWFKNELNSLIEEDLISDSFIKEQNIFNLEHIQSMKAKLYSTNPGDVQANLWSILVFNSWWKRYIL